MSEIRWCDKGGHPFSANDPDRRQFVETQVRNDSRAVYDICGPCDRKSDIPIGALTSSEGSGDGVG